MSEVIMRNKPGHYFEIELKPVGTNYKYVVREPGATHNFSSGLSAAFDCQLGDDPIPARFVVAYCRGGVPKRIEQGTAEYKKFIRGSHA